MNSERVARHSQVQSARGYLAFGLFSLALATQLGLMYVSFEAFLVPSKQLPVDPSNPSPFEFFQRYPVANTIVLVAGILSFALTVWDVFDAHRRVEIRILWSLLCFYVPVAIWWYWLRPANSLKRPLFHPALFLLALFVTASGLLASLARYRYAV